MSKIKLTGSNSGYVEISSAADAGNLTLALPTSGTALLGNGNNVYTGITTFTNDLKLEGASYDVLWDASDNQLEFGDNAKLSFGASSDLQLYHDGSHSRIKDVGTGILSLSASQCNIQNAAVTENMAEFFENGAVNLYYDNVKRFETTSTGAVVTGICTATSFSGDGSALSNTSNRRLNYNGAMLINQRGNATGVVASGYYALDRYMTQMHDNNSGTWSITQASDVPDGYGFKYSLEYGCTATSSDANRYLMTIYRMEGYDSQVFNYGTANAKTVTLSFWIKCSKAGNFQVNFENEQNPDAGYQTQQTINSAGQWEKKVVTIPGDTTKAFTWTNAKAMCFDIVYSAYGSSYNGGTPTAAWSALSNNQRGTHCNMDLFDSTSNYVKIAGVQLEIGSTATEFEHLPYQVELARCKRYYYQETRSGSTGGNGAGIFALGMTVNSSGGSIYATMNHPVEMRIAPTVTFSGTFAAHRFGVAINQITAANMSGTSYHNSTTATTISGTNSGSTPGQGTLAFLEGVSGTIMFDAEL